MLWPEHDDARTGPVLWAFLGVLGGLTAGTIATGLYRYRVRAKQRRRARRADEVNDSDDDDVFTWLSSGLAL